MRKGAGHENPSCQSIQCESVRDRAGPRLEAVMPGGERVAALAPGEKGEAHVEIGQRSEEHTSELQSLMRNSYAVFCLQKKKTRAQQKHITRETHQKQHD